MSRIIDWIKKYQNLSFFMLALGLVFVMYGSSLAGSFVFDDRSLIYYQDFLQSPFNWADVLKMSYWNQESGLYRPITLVSYSLNFAIFGTGAWSFHLINIILYALTGYLLFVFLKKVLGGKHKNKIALATSLLFLILPIHTEVVANIIGRAEIFALLFSILGLSELIKKDPNKWKILFWFLLAMGSKENAIAVLPIAFLLWLRNSKIIESKKNTLKDVDQFFFPAFLSGFIYLSVRFLILGFNFLSNNASLVENPLKFVSWHERIFTALNILWMYIYKSFIAFNLCSDYSYSQIPIAHFWNIGTLLGLVMIIFSVIGIIYFFKKNFNISLALALFLFPYLVVSNLLTPIGTIAGERLFYYPSAGLCLLVVIVGFGIWQKLEKENLEKTFYVLLALVSVFYIAKSFDRALDWMTEEKLFISAGQCASRSVLSLSNLATVYYFKGDYQKAEKIILDSYDIYDGYTKANNNLGLIYWKMGENEKAKEQFFKTFEHFPPYEGVYENLVLFYLSQDNEKEAMKWYKLGGR